jgi:hypothetical protein
VFHMNVLGKGPDRLNLPPELEPHVTVHRRLAFGAFYTVIYHNLVRTSKQTHTHTRSHICFHQLDMPALSHLSQTLLGPLSLLL